MKLSMAAELAIRGILDLATRYGKGPVPLEEICRNRNLPRPYLTKIFSSLTRAHLVASVRGKGGGYILARLPGEISLLDVIEAIEGPLALNLCVADPPQCEQIGCRVHPVWVDIQQHIRQSLDRHVLSELICSLDIPVLPSDPVPDSAKKRR